MAVFEPYTVQSCKPGAENVNLALKFTGYDRLSGVPTRTMSTLDGPNDTAVHFSMLIG